MSRHLGILLGEFTEPFRSGFHLDGGCDDREGEIEQALEGIEQAESLVHRVATMIRTIADLRIRLTRAEKSPKRLEEALRKILNEGGTGWDEQESRLRIVRFAQEALEETIPF